MDHEKPQILTWGHKGKYSKYFHYQVQIFTHLDKFTVRNLCKIWSIYLTANKSYFMYWQYSFLSPKWQLNRRDTFEGGGGFSLYGLVRMGPYYGKHFHPICYKNGSQFAILLWKWLYILPFCYNKVSYKNGSTFYHFNILMGWKVLKMERWKTITTKMGPHYGACLL
jgi:hypothetical protein